MVWPVMTLKDETLSTLSQARTAKPTQVPEGRPVMAGVEVPVVVPVGVGQLDPLQGVRTSASDAPVLQYHW